VRLTSIDRVDLNLFDFDYDLTLMVFFLSADGKVYARYGGRDADGPDERQSLKSLLYTMNSVLQMHAREKKTFAPRSTNPSKNIRQVAGALGSGRCFHCHQVREVLTADLQGKGKWSPDMYWRYPLPENLGFDVEVDRGNVVKRIKVKSPAAAVGLAKGDVVRRLHGVPTHSFGDIQYALDRAPRTGTIEIVWQRGDKVITDSLALPDDWRRTEMGWRASLRGLVPSLRLGGADLSPAEKKALGLSAKQLAFRQRAPVAAQAEAAGIRAGDVILGIDDKPLELDALTFRNYVESHYLIGEKVKVNVLRDGKRLGLVMTFERGEGRRGGRRRR
jgi:hypothetical protein